MWHISRHVMNDVFLQQTFDLSIKNKKTFENFVGQTNLKQKAMLQFYIHSASQNTICLIGPSGSGKTHLLQAACHAFQAKGGKATYISLKRPREIEALLNQTLSGNLICIDDVHLASGHPDLEHLLFKLYNHAELSGSFLIWGKRPNIDFERKDLQSRLQAMLEIQLQSYPPREILSILEQYLQDTQSSVPLNICEYLIKHYTRNIPSLISKLKEIEAHAHSLQKKVTLKMCKSLIEDLHLLDESI